MKKEDILKFLENDKILSIIFYQKGIRKSSNYVEILNYNEETEELLIDTMDEKNLLIKLENIISIDCSFFSGK